MIRTLKIAILSNVPAAWGMSGKSKEVNNIARFLKSKDRDITIISISEKRRTNKTKYYTEYEMPEITRRVKALRLLNLPSLLISGVWLTTEIAGFNRDLIRALRDLDPDLIISENFIFAKTVERYLKEKPLPVISSFDSFRVIESFASRIRSKEDMESIRKPSDTIRESVSKRYIRYNMQLYEKMLELSTIVIFPTAKDRDDVAIRFPKEKGKFFATHAHFIEKSGELELKKRIRKILFIGGYDHRPNRNAMMHIENEIAPKLPDKQFIIVGKGCPVKTIGNVKYMGEAESLNPIIKEADLCIAPLTEGSGFKIKVLDYFSHGKAIVGTSIAFEGYNVKNNVNAIIEDSIPSFPERIRELEDNPKKFAEIQKNSLKVTKDFSYANASRRWNRLLSIALKRKPPGRISRRN